MSADNWAQCPRCAKTGEARLSAQSDDVRVMYGVASVEEWDAAREALQKARADFERRTPTFREDYEIYGAEDGVVMVKYSGECTECHLKLKFNDSHPIPGC